ncbi:hypothetical protein TB2_009649 [Malus domestica]
MWNSAENVFARSGSFREGGDNEEALRNVVGDTMEIDVGELEAKDQKLLLDGLLAISFQPTEVGRNRKVRGSSFVGGGRHLLNNKPINLCLVD